MTARSPSTSPSAQAVPAASNFAELYASHFAFVWRCLQGLGVPREQLDDAAQETFVVVHNKLSEFQAELEVRPWLYGILRRVALNHRRGVIRRLHAASRLEAEPIAPEPGPFEAVQALQARQLLLEFLDSLEVNRREVFYLAEIEALSVPELAECIGIPLNTAYSRLRRARAEFTAWLGQRGVTL